MTAHDEEAIGDAVRRYATIWTIYGGVPGGGDHREDELLWRRWADSDLVIWNRLFVPPDAVTPAAVERSLVAAEAYLRRQSRFGVVAVARRRLVSLAPGRIGEIGLKDYEVMVEMDGFVGAMTLPPPSALRFERVTTMAMLDAYADINAEAYGLPIAAGRAGIAVAPGTMMLGAFSILAFEGDRMVSAASVLPHDGRLYLGLVATLPDAQRRGLASRTIAHALRVAHEATGLDHADLHATVAGAPVYARLGYRPVMEFALFQLAQAA